MRNFNKKSEEKMPPETAVNEVPNTGTTPLPRALMLFILAGALEVKRIVAGPSELLWGPLS